MKYVRGLKPLDRIMRHIRKTDDGHWLWMSRGRTGMHQEYGAIRGPNGKMMSSHRAVWIIMRGPIPEDKELLHQCDFTLCCNPDHLELDTHKKNVHDGLAKGLPRKKKLPLSRSTIEEIRQRLANGETQRSLAREYGITPMRASRISRRVHYAD